MSSAVRWVEDLRAEGEPARETAAEGLFRYLRAGLAKSLAGNRGVQESDLDDFTQEAIGRILAALDSFRGDSRFTTWAMTIALRVAYSALRKRRAGHVSLHDLDGRAFLAQPVARPWGQGADRDVERTTLLEALRRAILDRLTERQRTVIMAELQGVASERVAELLGTNRNAVYKVYHDARKNLRRALQDAGYQAEDVRALMEDAG